MNFLFSLIIIEGGNSTVWDWIITYWLQIVFGLIAGGFGLLAKKFWSMYQNEKERDVEKTMAECYAKVEGKIKDVHGMVDERDELIHESIERVHQDSIMHDEKMEQDLENLSSYIEVLKDGVLSVQGAHFRQQCKALLDDDRMISVDVFEQLTYDHTVYNKLGGNHLGDALYTAVESKFKAQQLSGASTKPINKQ